MLSEAGDTCRGGGLLESPEPKIQAMAVLEAQMGVMAAVVEEKDLLWYHYSLDL
jgi:hypothetical protein